MATYPVTRRRYRPSHPGEVLREDVLPAMRISVSAAARAARLAPDAARDPARQDRGHGGDGDPPRQVLRQWPGLVAAHAASARSLARRAEAREGDKTNSETDGGVTPVGMQASGRRQPN